jgi:hypothetical protein
MVKLHGNCKSTAVPGSLFFISNSPRWKGRGVDHIAGKLRHRGIVFARKAQELGELYDEYLKRQDTTLAQMGYVMEQVQAAALTEFRVRKKAPSAWRE